MAVAGMTVSGIHRWKARAGTQPDDTVRINVRRDAIDRGCCHRHRQQYQRQLTESVLPIDLEFRCGGVSVTEPFPAPCFRSFARLSQTKESRELERTGAVSYRHLGPAALWGALTVTGCAFALAMLQRIPSGIDMVQASCKTLCARAPPWRSRRSISLWRKRVALTVGRALHPLLAQGNGDARAAVRSRACGGSRAEPTRGSGAHSHHSFRGQEQPARVRRRVDGAATEESKHRHDTNCRVLMTCTGMSDAFA